MLPALLLLLPTAAAEGSAQLLGTATYRAALETGNTNKGDLGAAAPTRKTSLFVYARSGEQLALGSSSLLSTLATNAAAINVYSGAVDLTGTVTATPLLTCKAAADKTGLIENRTQETNGPSTTGATGYYKPCLYPVKTTGVYTVEILAPVPTGNANPSGIIVSSGWAAPTVNDSFVSAWDVTVLNGASAVPGRVWTTYLAMSAGSNGRPVTLNLYVQTKDGYRYRFIGNVDPYGFIFFANNKGVTTTAGLPSFQSASVDAATYGSPVVGADSGSSVTHKLFFNIPATDLPATTAGGDWLLTASPTLPPTPTNLTFAGRDGTSGYAGSTTSSTLGGTFTFNNPGSQSFSYRLLIPLSNNGVNNDRVLTGTATPGSNTVNWDGLDSDGKAVSAGTGNYTASVSLFSGDIHFPLLDSENAVGLNITRQVPGSGSGVSTLYWDDRPLTRPSAVTGAPSPDNTPRGADSATTAQHSWSNAFGDKKVMDTWAYYPSSSTNSGAIIVRSADLRIVKTSAVTTAPRGGTVTYTLTIQNLTTDTPGQPLRATVADALPGWATGSTWNCPTGCTATGGTGGLSTEVFLTGQTAVPITVTTTVALTTTSGSSLVNTATVTRASDAVDPETTNNTSSVTLTARDPVLKLDLLKTARNVTRGGANTTSGTSALPGDVLQYVITYTNSGEVALPNVSIGDNLPATLRAQTATFVCPSGTAIALTPAQSYSVALNTACGNGTTVPVGGGGTLTLNAVVR
ncbi:hypothetical protein ASF71_21735 [Deinococcus sp. Leaf326]|nr:hypothetical protein ASF71_21735 [Deinococcus sp. Leaf326]